MGADKNTIFKGLIGFRRKPLGHRHLDMPFALKKLLLDRFHKLINT